MTITLGIITIEIGCPHQDADDLEEGPDGDPACGDCRELWAENDHRRY